MNRNACCSLDSAAHVMPVVAGMGRCVLLARVGGIADMLDNLQIGHQPRPLRHPLRLIVGCPHTIKSSV